MTADLIARLDPLIARLQNAAYRHGNIDAQEFASDRKYREAHDASDAAAVALAAALRERDAELTRLRAENAALRRFYDDFMFHMQVEADYYSVPVNELEVAIADIDAARKGSEG